MHVHSQLLLALSFGLSLLTQTASLSQANDSDVWAPGVKESFGTAYTPYDERSAVSKVWFSTTEGVVSELSWPRVDRPQVRDSQFLITGPEGLFVEERKGTRSVTTWVESGVPAYKVINRDFQDRFVIERTVFADPKRDTVLVRVRLERKVPGLRVYLLHNPSVSNTPALDSARASRGEAPGPGLYAWEGSEAQAVLTDVTFKSASAGVSGEASDGYQQLTRGGELQDSSQTVHLRNVVLAGELALSSEPGVQEFWLAYGFGPSIERAHDAARASIIEGGSEILEQFKRGWRSYQASLTDLSRESGDQGVLFRASAAVLKSMEDKTYLGAFIAAPSIPWGNHQRASTERTGGYHLIWPRDLYQMATTFLALGDADTAVMALRGVLRLQFGAGDGSWEFGSRKRARDGSFKQNAWVDGEEYWGALQMDQVAYPLVLGYRLWKQGKIELKTVWPELRRAAEFVAGFGPWSQQERWEENFGASPSTVAAQIAGLWCASELAQAMGEQTLAAHWRQIANQWSSKPGDHLETWMFTTSGRHGDGKYFVRVEGASSPDQVWDPNDEAIYEIKNGGGMHREKDVIDGGFLELVRLGVRSARSESIQASIPELDATLKTDLPGIGPGYIRYTGDRYGYDPVTGAQTAGMLWPLLTGERGHYELKLASEQGLKGRALKARVAPYIRAMERMATPSLMIPEQLWDSGPNQGLPTGAATPLGWSHAEYVKLLRSQRDGQVFDWVPIVSIRAWEAQAARSRESK